MITILGAGIAGLSASYHLGHQNCQIFEKNNFLGGHTHSRQQDGFVWDEGPHVSFTENSYVRELFSESVKGDFFQFPVSIGNYFQGDWIPHPAQSNLWSIREPLRSACLTDFMQTRSKKFNLNQPGDYQEWLYQAFGKVFADTFPASYTKKYWTCEPKFLDTDWIGNRVFFPDIQTVVDGSIEPPKLQTHYIKEVRYPAYGGFVKFLNKLAKDANINLNHSVAEIDLLNKQISFLNGSKHKYEKLINTLPLPLFISLISHAPPEILEASEVLCCSSLLLVNVVASNVVRKPYHWLYVYDEDKLSTRVTHIEMLSPNNGLEGKTGIQVEVYESKYRPFTLRHDEIAAKVSEELIEMGMIEKVEAIHTQYVEYANVIFDKRRKEAQSIIFEWLELFGLKREAQDLHPITDWSNASTLSCGEIVLAGRFAQWKYFWTDDCVLRGRHLAR
jgi:protoporphyrinogen oxidase